MAVFPQPEVNHFATNVWPLTFWPYTSGSPVLVNGEEFENIEMSTDSMGRVGHPLQQGFPSPLTPQSSKHSCDIVITPEMSQDRLQHMVKNKNMYGGMEDNRLDKRLSVDSQNSDASTLMSTSSDTLGEDQHRKKSLINHHSIRGNLSDSEVELSGVSVISVIEIT